MTDLLSNAWKAQSTPSLQQYRFNPLDHPYDLQARVTALAASPNGRRLATAADDGCIFFFDRDGSGQLTPLLYTTLPGKQPSCVSWSMDSTMLLVGCR